jgi:hypothetical protein
VDAAFVFNGSGVDSDIFRRPVRIPPRHEKIVDLFYLISFFTAKTQRAQRKDNFLFPLIPLKAGSTENNKISKLCFLRGSNEQSEWAVNYRIKTDSGDLVYMKMDKRYHGKG